MSWREFLEWREFYALAPFGEERDDIRAASIVQALVSMQRNVETQPRWYPLTEFLLKFGDAPRVEAPLQDWREQMAIGKLISMGSVT